MYELLLITIITGAPAEPTKIESQAVEYGMEIDECTDMSSAFVTRRMQLPTGQRLILKMSCQKMETR